MSIHSTHLGAAADLCSYNALSIAIALTQVNHCTPTAEQENNHHWMDKENLPQQLVQGQLRTAGEEHSAAMTVKFRRLCAAPSLLSMALLLGMDLGRSQAAMQSPEKQRGHWSTGTWPWLKPLT